MRNLKTYLLLTALVATPPAIAQQASNDASGDNDADATAGTRDKDDRRSPTRRRVEEETAQWVEQILEEKRERESRR